MNEAEAQRIAAGSLRNRDQVTAVPVCGCFYCRATFPGGAVQAWVDDGKTALCPRCGIDSVLPNVIAGVSLRWLHHHRFEVVYRLDEAGVPIRVVGE
jgi:hypothetical protein